MTPMLVSNWTTGLPPPGAVSAPKATPQARDRIAANRNGFRIGTPRFVMMENVILGQTCPGRKGRAVKRYSTVLRRGTAGYLRMMVPPEGAAGPGFSATQGTPAARGDRSPAEVETMAVK